MENKRLTAKKVSIRELSKGKFVKKTGFESSYILTSLGRKISRARVMGNVVDKYVSPDEKYATITIDDGNDTFRCKSFINIKIFDGISEGELVDIIGKIREYNGEIYLVPEIISKSKPNAETLRFLELEKIYREQKSKIDKIKELQKQTSDVSELKNIAKEFMSLEDAESILESIDFIEQSTEEKEVKKSDAKDKVLEIIKTEKDGIEYNSLIKRSGLSENIIDTAVQELLESGVCFEPKPGLIKRL